MSGIRLVRFFLLFGALSPTLAFALSETYEGMLQPDTRDPRIPIVIELRDVGMDLQGKVKTSGPFKGEGSFGSGDYTFGQCTVQVDLSATLVLRLSGSCSSTSFNGTYSLRDKQKRWTGYGTFNLPRKTAEVAKGESRRTVTGTEAGCLKANTQCLLACPRTQESADFWCSNRCRVKLRNCKAQVKKAPLPDVD